MQASFWKNLIRFAFLILLQALVLEHLYLPGNLHLILYPIAILLLPLQTPPMLLVLTGFFCGFLVDLFSGIPGLNAAAATFLAFCRIIYFKIVDNRDVLHDSELAGTPLPSLIGWGGFIRYSAWMTVLFHMAYFMTAVCSFRNFPYTLYLMVGSSALCFIGQILTVSLFVRKGTKR